MLKGMRLKASLIILSERRMTLYIGGWLTFRSRGRKTKHPAFQQSDVMSVGMNGYIAYLTPIPKSLASIINAAWTREIITKDWLVKFQNRSHFPFLELY